MRMTWINLLRKELMEATVKQACDECRDLIWSDLKHPLALQFVSQIRTQIDRQLEWIF